VVAFENQPVNERAARLASRRSRRKRSSPRTARGWVAVAFPWSDRRGNDLFRGSPSSGCRDRFRSAPRTGRQRRKCR
jgi:hypothetical protein